MLSTVRSGAVEARPVSVCVRAAPKRPRLLKGCRCSAGAPEVATGGAGYANPLSSISLELLNNAQVYNLRSLDQAEDELEAYCSMLSDDEQADRCWDAYEYLENKRRSAEEGCALELRESGQPGPSCQRLQQLERLTYELLGSGEVSGMVSALATLNRAEKRAAERAAAHKESEAVAWYDEGGEVMAVGALDADTIEETTGPDRRDYLRALFMQVDRNHNQRLDMDEFLQAMRLLGDELSERTVELIGEAMNTHGFLDEDQFIQVVEAEELASRDKVAELWRQHPIRSRWWGEEAPHKWGGVMEG